MRKDDDPRPDGRLYIQPPGRTRQAYDITSHMDFLDWLKVAGVVLGALGLIMVTPGAAAPGVVAAGGAFLTAGAAVGATAAVVDTVQAHNKGRLTGTRLALNAREVVASVATAGFCTIMPGPASAGALARLGTNANYIFLNRAAAAADV